MELVGHSSNFTCEIQKAEGMHFGVMRDTNAGGSDFVGLILKKADIALGAGFNLEQAKTLKEQLSNAILELERFANAQRID